MKSWSTGADVATIEVLSKLDLLKLLRVLPKPEAALLVGPPHENVPVACRGIPRGNPFWVKEPTFPILRRTDDWLRAVDRVLGARKLELWALS